MKPEDRPIGYWIKQLDRLLEDTFDRVLADHDLSRRHWQVLNVLSSGPVSDEAVHEALRPFATQGADIHRVLDELARRGWSEQDTDGRHRLGPSGRTAYDELAGKVRALRTAATHGVTGEEYAAVLATLQRMVANLQAAA